MKATAKANTNIALIKYWGKRDKDLFLPMNSSLSITLDKFHTITTVEFIADLKEDTFKLNNLLASKEDKIKISKFLDKVRALAGVPYFANVNSTNNVPTAAGFASSASGYAALAAASVKALDLNLSLKDLSILARQGSGSAARSIYGGFVEWQMGSLPDGTDSYARQLIREDEWDLSILSAVCQVGHKTISSREGMKLTVETSPFYKGWLDSVSIDLEDIKQAIAERDFIKLGEITERNALKMHATMLAANPPIIYFDSGTLEVIHCIRELRNQGIYAYCTVDAGANVKILCKREEEDKVTNILNTLQGVKEVIACHPGGGISYL